VQSPLNINIKNSNPGPGAYGPGVEINKFGVYNVSNLRNSLAANWSPSSRFVDELRHSKNFPGPGTYREVDCMSESGKFISSNYKSPGSMRYKGDSRPKRGLAASQANTPGPGAYGAPSEFGNTQKHFLKNMLLQTDSTVMRGSFNNTMTMSMGAKMGTNRSSISKT